MFDRRLLSNFDWYLLFPVPAICLVGTVAIQSASQGYVGEVSFWYRQLSWIGVGLLACFIVLLVDFRTIGHWSYLLHGFVVASLAALVFIDSAEGGVNRWFAVGPVAIQPSEFVKITSVLAIAYYFRDSRQVGGLGLKGILVPALLVLVPFFLVVQQPDLGTALLILLSTFPIFVLAGIHKRILITIAVTGILAITSLITAFQLGTYRIHAPVPTTLARQGAGQELVARLESAVGQEFSTRADLRRVFFDDEISLDNPYLDLIAGNTFRPYISHVFRPYQQKRLLTFLDPNKDPLGAGYHVIQSKIAIGSGRFWGKGFGNSTQGALNFLPARHTDFLFSIFAEEWGFVGVLGLLTLYGALIVQGFRIVLQTRDRFSVFLTMGIASIIAAQVLVNVGMVVGMLPVVGVPLPFFSYGGSSMVSLMAGLGLILNIRMRRFLWT